MPSVLVLAFSSLISSGRASAQEAAQLIYVTTLADTTIAREVVVLAENGWTSEVALDLPQQKVTFKATLERGEGSRLGWKVEVETAGSPVVNASYDAGTVQVDIQPAGVERSFELEDDAEEVVPFFFENLMWACFHEVARHLVPLAEAGELGAETRMTGILAQHSKELGLTVAGFERDADRGWRFETRLEGGTEVRMLCDATGLPTRFEVPSQSIVVSLEGRELATSSEGRSIVDRGPWRAQLSQPTHEVVHETGLRVPMRDGIELAADVYRPAGEGKFPAILIRTPYNRRNEGLANGQRFAKRGYAVCVQDVRGRFESGGDFRPLHQETADGSDTLDWLAGREWCDGQIGMIGGSYGGVVQWFAARSGNPHLKAIVPQVSPPDPQENFPYEGGVFMLAAAWWSKVLTTMDSNGGNGLPEGSTGPGSWPRSRCATSTTRSRRRRPSSTSGWPIRPRTPSTGTGPATRTRSRAWTCRRCTSPAGSTATSRERCRTSRACAARRRANAPAAVSSWSRGRGDTAST